MVKITSLLTFFFLICLSACQVKEAASNGGLISGHAPTTNKFSLTGPANKVYVEGEILRFKVSFPFDIENYATITQPLLNIKIGGTNHAVVLKNFSTPKELIFEYTITSTDNAPSGIEVQSLSLNGSVLEFLKDGNLVNCDISTIQSTILSQVKIDTEKPTVTSMTMSLIPTVYHTGDEVIFSLGFSEKVFVTGTPEFGFNLDATAVNATYVSGSGTALLLFSYKVQSSNYDITGFNNPVTDIILASATIKDTVGNGANTVIAAGIKSSMLTVSAIHQVIATLPYVVAVKLPINDSYVVAKALDFEIEFDRAVNVSLGSVPKYEFAVGTNGSTTPRYANYASGSGTKKLIFSYVTVPGDEDPDGIEVAKEILRDGINDIVAVSDGVSFFTALSNKFSPPSSAGIILTALFPKVISVARNADTTTEKKTGTTDNVWIIGQPLLITANFNTNIYVNITNGRPAIEFFIGGVKKEASYLSGGNGQTSLIFTYDIVENDFDNVGDLNLGAIVTHGGTITDSVNTVANLTLPASSKLSTIRIDGIRPTISSLTPPADKIYSNVVTGMNYVVGWSEEVHLGDATGLSLNINIGGSITNFPTSFVPVSTITSSFTQPSLTGKNDNVGVTLASPLVTSGKVFDIAGNEALDLSFPLPGASVVKVDTKAPIVLSATPLIADGIYKAGQEIKVSVVFDEIVETKLSGTTHHLKLKIGTANRFLVPVSAGIGTSHDFTYTVQPGDTGVFAIQNVFAGAIYDLAQNTPATFTKPLTPGIMIDAVVPTISLTSGIVAANTLVAGDNLQVSITFSEVVTVSGAPSLPVAFGTAMDDDLIYSSGSGTTTLVFSRTVTPNHFNMVGLPSSTTSINLNGGEIVDAGNNDVPLTFPTKAINLSGIKITYPEVLIWSRADFKNIAPSPTTITNTGGITTTPCGAGNCRTFNDSDNLTYSGTLNKDAHTLMVLKTPSALGPHQIVSSNIQLDDVGAGQYDIVFGGTGSLISAPGPFDPSTLYLIHAHNQPLVLDNTMDFFSATFDGAVGEIIIIDAVIAPAKLNTIKAYLSGQF